MAEPAKPADWEAVVRDEAARQGLNEVRLRKQVMATYKRLAAGKPAYDPLDEAARKIALRVMAGEVSPPLVSPTWGKKPGGPGRRY